MDYFISTQNDCGSGQKFKDKESFLKEMSLMIDDCIANGGSSFEVDVTADASCFYNKNNNK